MLLKISLVMKIIALCLGIFFILYFFYPNKVRNYIVYSLDSVKILLPFVGSNVNSPQEDIQSLKDSLLVVSEQNRRLEKELGFVDLEKRQIPVKLLAAKSRVYGNAFLNVEGLNVYPGDFVYARGGVLAGTVSSVEEGVARLDFLGSKDKFIAEILSTGELIELNGSGIGYYKGQLPKTSNIQSGEIIVMKGFPKAIVGIVGSVEDSETSLYSVWVRSSINLSKLEIFYVDAK